MREGRESIPFQPFHPRKPVRIYRRNLPHWRQDGCTYFVTFRAADSIPWSVLTQWQQEDEAWFAAHGIKGPLSEPAWHSMCEGLAERERKAFEKHRARRMQVALDECLGACLLRSAAARKIVEDALLYHDGERCACGDFVVMPNHVHWLVLPHPGNELEDVLESVKQFSSRLMTKAGLKDGRFWQKENYDHIVRNEEELHAFRKYIAENPAKARLREGEYSVMTREWV